MATVQDEEDEEERGPPDLDGAAIARAEATEIQGWPEREITVTERPRMDSTTTTTTHVFLHAASPAVSSGGLRAVSYMEGVEGGIFRRFLGGREKAARSPGGSKRSSPRHHLLIRQHPRSQPCVFSMAGGVGGMRLRRWAGRRHRHCRRQRPGDFTSPRLKLARHKCWQAADGRDGGRELADGLCIQENLCGGI